MGMAGLLLKNGRSIWYFPHKKRQENLGEELNRKQHGGIGDWGYSPESIRQGEQVRNVPVVMVGRRVVKDRSGGFFLVKQKLSRALRLILSSYLGSDFL